MEINRNAPATADGELQIDADPQTVFAVISGYRPVAVLESRRQVGSCGGAGPAGHGVPVEGRAEQFDIIDRFYLQMLRYHWPEGPAFTHLLTLAGAPSVSGADPILSGTHPLETDRRRHAAGLPRRRA